MGFILGSKYVACTSVDSVEMHLGPRGSVLLSDTQVPDKADYH